MTRRDPEKMTDAELARHYRQRATEARAIASSMDKPEARHKLELVARDYEQLAAQLEASLRATTPPSQDV